MNALNFCSAPIIVFILFLLSKAFFIVVYTLYKHTYTSCICGRDAASCVLEANRTHYIRIEKRKHGKLGHFDMKNNVINLSKEVYNGSSLSHIALSAHEAAHSIQYLYSYDLLRFRSLVLGSEWYIYTVFVCALILSMLFSVSTLSVILSSIIILFALVHALALITEMRASIIAYKGLKNSQSISRRELFHIKIILISLIFA